MICRASIISRLAEEGSTMIEPKLISTGWAWSISRDMDAT